MEPAHVGQGTFNTSPHSDQLGGDGNRDFFGRDGADIQANRSVNPLKYFSGDALFQQFAKTAAPACRRDALG
jgi:hypothetical protein